MLFDRRFGFTQPRSSLTSAKKGTNNKFSLSQVLEKLRAMRNVCFFDGLLKIYAMECCECLRSGIHDEIKDMNPLPIPFIEK
jgi:hypothetical protein